MFDMYYNIGKLNLYKIYNRLIIYSNQTRYDNSQQLTLFQFFGVNSNFPNGKILSAKYFLNLAR